MSELNDAIRAYFASNPAMGKIDALGDADSLLEAGIIDSLAMVDLIRHLEDEYAITIDEDDMVPENFDSIACIAQYVSEKRDNN